MGIHSRKLPVPRRFYNPSDIFSKLGLSRGRNLNQTTGTGTLSNILLKLPLVEVLNSYSGC